MKRDLMPEAHPTVLGDARFISSPWGIGSSAVAFVVLVLLATYASTAKSIVEIWLRSDTFAHGFVVLPIVVWLVWRKREELATMVPRPAWWAIAPAAAAGFLWLVGELGAVSALSQFAFVAFLVAGAVAVLGLAISRKLAFALAFLFFAVPIGEFMTPKLMDWTADFTVLALRASGVPVYREGLHFVIPSGSWSVVEACSGFRYLVASLMVGTLFAYLSYRSLKRRLIFVAFAFLVPIVANWLRAYMIVMLGHLSDNKLAAGVDHLIYGWLFFGVVIASLFWIGARWREDPPAEGIGHPPRALSRAPMGAVLIAAGLLAGIAISWKVGYWTIEANAASAAPQLSVIERPGGWQSSSESLSDWRPYFENPSAELHQTFSEGNRSAGLFIAYYRNQRAGHELISSNNALVRTLDLRWVSVGGALRSVVVGSEPVDVRTSELRGERGQRLQVWHWYWVDGRLTSSDHWAKLYSVMSRLRGGGDDSAAVIVYAAKEQSGSADETLESFVRAAAPAIDSTLQRARSGR